VDYDKVRVLLEAEVLDNHQLICLHRGFGEQMEMLASEGLREEFKSTVERLKIMYR